MKSVSITCPGCTRPAKKLIAGVCERCRKRFAAAHGKKLTTEWTEEDFTYRTSSRAPADELVADPAGAVMDSGAGEGSFEPNAESVDFFRRAFRLIIQYQGDQIMALYAFCLACEWFELVGCEEAVQVAVKLFGDRKKKAAVTKAVKLFQDSLGIEPGRGQRSQEGRRAMATARGEQLVPEEKTP